MLYVDADTVFTDDIIKLYNNSLNDKVIGLFTKAQCSERGDIEIKLLYKYGKKPESFYFGSCLALINTEKYRTFKKSELCQKTAVENPFELMLWDQTILNCVFGDEEIYDFSHLGHFWVQEASRSGSGIEFKPGMLHFCGAPKPWDLLGEIYHPYYKEWHVAATSAGLSLPMIWNYLSLTSWRRAIRAKNQYKVWLN
jgi:lipopolysaccharide biosynthesis glycosyltransferase